MSQYSHDLFRAEMQLALL